MPDLERTVSSPEQGRIVERNFDVLPTHLPDFVLLVDHNAEPEDITRRATTELRDTARVFVARAEDIKRLEELQKGPRRELVDLPSEYPGIRGARDLEEGVEVQINPRTRDEFYEPNLRMSLGDRFEEVAHGKVTITLELDPDKDDVEKFTKSMWRWLNRQKAGAAQVAINRSLRVDTSALAEMIEKGEIDLLPGSWAVVTEGFSVVPRKIASKKDREIAEERIQDAQPNS